MNTSLITYAPEPPSDRVSWTNWNKQIQEHKVSVSHRNESINQLNTNQPIDWSRSIVRSMNLSIVETKNRSINQSTIKLFFMPKSWGYNYHWETLWSRNERQLPTPPWTQKRRQLRSLNFFINNTLVEKKKKKKRTKQTKNTPLYLSKVNQFICGYFVSSFTNFGFPKLTAENNQSLL